MAWHPTQPLVASVGSEGELRLWTLVRGKQSADLGTARQSHWRCKSVATFRGEAASLCVTLHLTLHLVSEPWAGLAVWACLLGLCALLYCAKADLVGSMH